MKKIARFLLMMLPVVAALFSCSSDEEIIFEVEKPQFELKDNAILLEVILPPGSSATDTCYIVGDFNGGDAAIGNMAYQLEKATGTVDKWGVYIYPNDYVGGKTLADGFHFVSVNEGVERTVLNKEVTHQLNVSIGSRTNVWVSRWESFFIVAPEPEVPTHDGYVIYVEDNSGWPETTLYAWGSDLPELFGGWPGILPTGKEVKNGVTYNYYDTGAANSGLLYNFIFNNNNGGSQFDGLAFTLNRDYYLRITDKSCEEIDLSQQIEHDGHVIYVEDKSGWDEMTIYAWGSEIPELFGGWPGAKPTGTVNRNGVTYKYFDMGAANEGLTYNLIFNNNNGGSQFDGPQIVINADYYYSITEGTCTVVE